MWHTFQGYVVARNYSRCTTTWRSHRLNSTRTIRAVLKNSKRWTAKLPGLSLTRIRVTSRTGISLSKIKTARKNAQKPQTQPARPSLVGGVCGLLSPLSQVSSFFDILSPGDLDRAARFQLEVTKNARWRFCFDGKSKRPGLQFKPVPGNT